MSWVPEIRTLTLLTIFVPMKEIRFSDPRFFQDYIDNCVEKMGDKPQEAITTLDVKCRKYLKIHTHTVDNV